MPKTYGYPSSRDFELQGAVECHCRDCLCHDGDQHCAVPSKIRIKRNGVCEMSTKRIEEEVKDEG